MMRATADIERCEGHGLCEAAAPEVFLVDDEGYVTVLLDPVPTHLELQAKVGARACPVAALTISER